MCEGVCVCMYVSVCTGVRAYWCVYEGVCMCVRPLKNSLCGGCVGCVCSYIIQALVHNICLVDILVTDRKIILFTIIIIG